MTYVTKKMLLDLNEKLEEENSSAELQHSNLLDEDLNILEVDESTRLEVALSKISSDVPRGDGTIDLATLDNYWLGMVWAIRSHNLPDGEQLARQWSMQSDLRFTEEGFRDAWNAYDSTHENPIGIGSVYKLAQEFDARKNKLSFLEKLRGWSSTGESEAMEKKMLEDKFVLDDLALLGQWTNFYASHGVGKTLMTIRLLKDAIESGVLDGRQVFYVNADDNYKGSVEKLAIAEELGIEMLLPHRNDFDPDMLVSEMREAAKKDEARNIIIVLDTLKKFADLMDKTKGTAFGKVARHFVQAGGTLICLAHTNKHKDSDGKSVYSGTTDIADDSDCVYIIDKLDEDQVSGSQTIVFRNEKSRGNVIDEKSFSYYKHQGAPYADFLETIEAIDPEAAELARKTAESYKRLKKDNRIVGSIKEALEEDKTLALTNLMEIVHERSGRTIADCREVADRYSGDHWDEFVFWKISSGINNRKALAVLPNPFGNPKTQKPEEPS
ncbi:MAG: hypothetical protein HN738_04870 [Gammaproteobacteria bacterium]|nr:hypothetical protein [Gammaproteobacteria bacterium]